MKILAIGDPHGDMAKIRKIPLKGIDLILLTGDIGKADLARKRAFENIERKKQGLEELDKDAKYDKAIHLEIHNSTIDALKYLSRHAPVYFIQGNVGIATRRDASRFKKKSGINIPCTIEMIDKMRNAYLVKNRLRAINNLRFGFLEYFVDTCWIKEFKPSDYAERMREAKKESDKARRVLRRFGQLDILICHQPPYRILDKVAFNGAPKHWIGKHAGSKIILDYIERKQPKYVFCGHIHEGEGCKKVGKTEVCNLGVCGYKIVNL